MIRIALLDLFDPQQQGRAGVFTVGCELNGGVQRQPAAASKIGLGSTHAAPYGAR